MTRTARFTVAMAVAAMAVIGSPVSAHKMDSIRAGRRAGPIKLNETRLRQLKDWFGEPTAKKVTRVGCIRAVRMRWGRRIVAIAPRFEGKVFPVAEVRVSKREVHFDSIGDLRLHTRRGLRVGDSERRLRRLYPHARGETHRGHTHYILRSGPSDGRLLAKVVDKVVVDIVTGPYEFC